MAEQSLTKNILKKGIFGIVVGVVVFLAAEYVPPMIGEHAFPLVFKIMFFMYAILGAIVFILLDAPSMKRLEGVKAIVGLGLFYVILSGVYIGGASSFPQFDPEIEKGKIEKILERRRAMTEQGKAEELIARAKVLNERAMAITKRLDTLGVGAQVEVAKKTSTSAASGDLVALGREQWDLQECYNCHKLFGHGGKKRGPILDNIGNLMTPEQLREKILYPKTWMAEGFDKQFKKGKMPDKYRDLMFDEEVDALVAFLATLKDTSVKTPKPIKMKK